MFWEIFNFSKYKQFLTKNERNKLYLRKNSSKGRLIADSKWKTKQILMEKGVSVAKLIARFRKQEEVRGFDWSQLEGNFVIKPASGFGGEGIVIIRKATDKNRTRFKSMAGKIYSIEDLKIHSEDILSGKYSLHSAPDMVLVEERVKIHPKFLYYTKIGTPDIRIIVYNQVPVMAMLRIPTVESGGRANLEQGAIGLGIDLASGLTTFGVRGKGEIMEEIYHLKLKKMKPVGGIKIPEWKSILDTAFGVQKAIPSLGFVGIDLVLDKERGPVVLEVNSRPGLSIQLCNRAGLKGRMEKVEDIEVKSMEHARQLAKYLFGERIKFEEGLIKEKPTIGHTERIRIKIGPKRSQRAEVRAKVDTGAWRSSIDGEYAKELGLLKEDNVLYHRHYRSSLGVEKERPVVGVTFWLQGRKIETAVNVANRNKLRTKFLLGRRDLKGFLIRTASPEKVKIKKIIKVKKK